VIPTVPMAVLAAVHVGFVIVKARSEERSLLAMYGQTYAEYCQRTGRFFPRMLWTSR
jgi:protein-S-isoprenylcysteine O-methyltransferase Ste14